MPDKSVIKNQRYQPFEFSGGLKGLVSDSCSEDLVPGWFTASYWEVRARAVEAGGRGGAWFVDNGAGKQWVLRKYIRGGLVARFSHKKFVYTRQAAVRSLAEFKTLVLLYEKGLPVPAPVAASYCRSGLVYEAAIVMERLPDVQPFGHFVDGRDVDVWGKVGETIRRFHDVGVYHADLNCFNILVGPKQVYLIDFDKAKLKNRRREDWKQANLDRLERSLRKLDALTDSSQFSGLWYALLQGYKC